MRDNALPLHECTDVLELWRGRLHVELQLLEALSQQIAQVDQQLDALGSRDDRVRLLQSVPGVGPRLAETVVAHLDDPHCFQRHCKCHWRRFLLDQHRIRAMPRRAGRRGPLTIEDGGSVSSNTSILIGFNFGSTGTVTISGEDSTLTTDFTLDVGAGGGQATLTSGNVQRSIPLLLQHRSHLHVPVLGCDGMGSLAMIAHCGDVRTGID